MRLHRARRIMLVTGATGFLGKHLLHGPSTADWEVIAPSHASMDVTRRDHTIATIRDWKPNVVVHLAYDKNDRPSIVDGTRHVAQGASAAKSRLIHLSTDLVFPGRAAPYRESDDPFPIVAYGSDKLAAERAATEENPGAVIVRTSLLYGTERPADAQIELRRMLRSPPTRRTMAFFSDEFRCPTHAADLAGAISNLAARQDVAGVLHVAGGECVSRARLATLFARRIDSSHAPIPTTTIPESGLIRPGRIDLDVSRAALLGIACRPVSTVLN